jgi:hypothetical protein
MTDQYANNMCPQLRDPISLFRNLNYLEMGGIFPLNRSIMHLIFFTMSYQNLEALCLNF